MNETPNTPMPKRKWKKVLAFILLPILVIVLSIGSYAAYSLWNVQNKLTSKSVKLETSPKKTSDPQVADFQGAFNMLLVGSDQRDSATPEDTTESVLNDVNLLVHISEDHKRISVVSFPRDLMVHMPDCEGNVSYGDSQINTALQKGGLSCAVKTVESLTGLSIPYAALVNFRSVVSLTDKIGGVPICLATPIRDEINGGNIFEAGDSNLSGDQALLFVRMRHGVGDGSDLGRINNQQVFMKNAMAKILSGGLISNPVKTIDMANILLDNTSVSESLADMNTLLSLSKVVKSIGLENTAFYTVPYMAYPQDRNRLALNEAAAAQLISEITALTVAPTEKVEAAVVVPVETPTVTAEPATPVAETKVPTFLEVIANPPVITKIALPVFEGGNTFQERNAAGVYCGMGSGY